MNDRGRSIHFSHNGPAPVVRCDLHSCYKGAGSVCYVRGLFHRKFEKLKSLLVFPRISSPDHALENHVIATSLVRSDMDCSFDCFHNPRCVSFNFGENPANPAQTPAVYSCELSDELRACQPGDYARRPGYTYHEILKVRVWRNRPRRAKTVE